MKPSIGYSCTCFSAEAHLDDPLYLPPTSTPWLTTRQHTTHQVGPHYHMTLAESLHSPLATGERLSTVNKGFIYCFFFPLLPSSLGASAGLLSFFRQLRWEGDRNQSCWFSPTVTLEDAVRNISPMPRTPSAAAEVNNFRFVQNTKLRLKNKLTLTRPRGRSLMMN